MAHKDEAPGMIEFDVAIDDTRWQAIGPEDLLAQCAKTVRALAPELYRAGNVDILLCDDTQIQALNKQWRDKDQPTNVLSFPSDPGPHIPGMPDHLGDLALTYDVCAREACEKNISIDRHFAHLVVHGLLHLFGYDHIAPRDAEEMEALEVQILAEMDIENPYITD